MKTRLFALLTFLAASAPAAENAYDVLGKTLAPFINLLAKDDHVANRALSLEVRVVDATGLPAEFANTIASAQLQYPDKLLLHAPVLGENVTLCRNGQQLWAIPGAKIEAILNRADLPKVKKKYKLENFELPIPQQQLVFLPVLFQIADRGEVVLRAQTLRLLDVRLMPELARSLGVEDWAARIWITADCKPAKLELTQPKWRGDFIFQKVEFSAALPASTWMPAPDQTDVLKLTPQRFKQLLDAAVGATRRD